MATRINMIGIFTSNLLKMVSFYRDVLGFDIEWDGKGPYAEFNNEGVRFSMYERSQLAGLLGQAPTYPLGINGTFELALDFPTSAEADAVYERITQAGAKSVYPPRDEPWGMHSAMVLDPDGNLIEIGSWNKGIS